MEVGQIMVHERKTLCQLWRLFDERGVGPESRRPISKLSIGIENLVQDAAVGLGSLLNAFQSELSDASMRSGSRKRGWTCII
jgi:hypothetical protein